MAIKLSDPRFNGLLRLGSLFMLVFLVDQIKVEFLRYAQVDYWHFVFCLLAILVGAADVAKEQRGIRGESSRDTTADNHMVSEKSF